MTSPVAPVTNRIKDLIDELLDRDYYATAGRTLDAIQTNATTGLIGKRLSELQVEAQRLQAIGQTLTPDNPVYVTFRGDLDQFLNSATFLMDGSAGAVRNIGVNAAGQLTRGLALGDVNDRQLEVIGIRWNTPDPEVVNRIVGYVDNPAWQASLQQYRDYIPEVVNNTLLKNFASGINPMATVFQISDMMEQMPVHHASTLLRSLQLTSYRDATAMHQLANADIIEKVIRIAALDHRTCLGCIALHGTEIPLGDRVDDHRNGRCTSISVVKGYPRQIQSGEDWFQSQHPSRQHQIMGSANYNAWKDGAVQLSDFPKRAQDKVFGPVIVENSLIGVLGPTAEKYYVRNGGNQYGS